MQVLGKFGGVPGTARPSSGGEDLLLDAVVLEQKQTNHDNNKNPNTLGRRDITGVNSCPFQGADLDSVSDVSEPRQE